MALADPDLPAGVRLPLLSADPPPGLDADRYRRLRGAFDALPRRSRVIVVLRLPIPGRRPLTLRAIGARLDLGPERVRQLGRLAIRELSVAWSAEGVSTPDRPAELAAIFAAALDRYPVGDDPDEGELSRRPVARGPRSTPASRLGAAVAAERRRQGKSLGDLARAAGMHPSQVSLLERGLRDPRLSTILRLAGALEVPVDQLLEGILPTAR